MNPYPAQPADMSEKKPIPEPMLVGSEDAFAADIGDAAGDGTGSY
jgi:hypothetical protein